MGGSIEDLIGLVIFAIAIAIPIVLWKRKKRIAAVVSVIVIFLLWLAIALPNFKGVSTYARSACGKNLKVIQKAKTDWAKQNSKQPSDIPTESDLVGVGKFLPEMPKCPSGGTFTIGPVNQNPTCSLIDRGHAISDQKD